MIGVLLAAARPGQRRPGLAETADLAAPLHDFNGFRLPWQIAVVVLVIMPFVLSLRPVAAVLTGAGIMLWIVLTAAQSVQFFTVAYSYLGQITIRPSPPYLLPLAALPLAAVALPARRLRRAGRAASRR
jgi:hypothetical protein